MEIKAKRIYRKNAVAELYRQSQQFRSANEVKILNWNDAVHKEKLIEKLAKARYTVNIVNLLKIVYLN